MKQILISALIPVVLTACIYVPVSNKDSNSATCRTVTHSMSLEVTSYSSGGTATPSNMGSCQGPSCAAFLAGIVAVAATVSAGSAVISGSIVVSNNTIHWLEYQGTCSDGYLNNAKQKLFGSFPTNAQKVVGSPEVDLKFGVATHDFFLITKSLENGADINYHEPSSPGIFCYPARGRAKAVSENRLDEFDKETDKLVDLLISRGASPAIISSTGRTFVDCTGFLPTHTLHKLLMRGWPNDYSYWLYAGVVLQKSDIIKEAVEHGANPNNSIRDGRYLDFALMSLRGLSDKGQEAEQRNGLEAMEELLKSGAKVDDGDIVRTYVYLGDHQNIYPVFELLIKYASPETINKSLDRLKKNQSAKNHLSTSLNQQANLEWLVKRLSR